MAAIATAACALAAPAAAHGSAAVDWSATASSYTTNARTHTMLHIAIHDALNAVDRRYETYLTGIDAPAGASAPAAAAAAARGVLYALATSDAQRQTIENRYAQSLAPIPDGEAKANGIAVGQQVAQAILSERTGDGFGSGAPYPGSSEPGAWRPTPPAFMPGIATDQAKARTFVLRSRDQFPIEAPPALDSAEYAAELEEVRAAGSATNSNRTQEQTDIARSWGASGTALAAQWLRAVATDRDLGEWEAARVFATGLTAATDAVIASFHYKYLYNYWRPVTAIRLADQDGNPATEPDPGWTPLMFTPPFPEWPSAHCTATGAITEVLRRTFPHQVVGFTFTSTALPGYTRQIADLDQLDQDCVDARVWAGVHFRRSDEVGVSLGRRAGHFTFRHAFRAVPGHAGK